MVIVTYNCGDTWNCCQLCVDLKLISITKWTSSQVKKTWDSPIDSTSSFQFQASFLYPYLDQIWCFLLFFHKTDMHIDCVILFFYHPSLLLIGLSLLLFTQILPATSCLTLSSCNCPLSPLPPPFWTWSQPDHRSHKSCRITHLGYWFSWF